MEHTEHLAAAGTTTPSRPTEENPLRVDDTLDYGLFDFCLIRDEHWMPALEVGITAQREAVEAIAEDHSPASVASVLLPLGLSRRLLSRVERAFSWMFSVHARPERQQVQQKRLRVINLGLAAAEAAARKAGHRRGAPPHPNLPVPKGPLERMPRRSARPGCMRPRSLAAP